MSDNLKTDWMKILGKHVPEVVCAQAVIDTEKHFPHRPPSAVSHKEYLTRLQQLYAPKRLPIGLRECLRRMVDKRRARSLLKQESDTMHHLATNYRVRYVERVETAFRKTYDKVGFRQASGYWGGNHEVRVTVLPNGKTGRLNSYKAGGGNAKTWHHSFKYSGLDSYHTFSIPLGWYSNVYTRGLAIIDDHLVLYAEPYKSTNPNALVHKVWYVQQAAGFKLKLEQGFAAIPAPPAAAGTSPSASSACERGVIAPTRAGALRKLSVLSTVY